MTCTNRVWADRELRGLSSEVVSMVSAQHSD
jgi:hypothetical protein